MQIAHGFMASKHLFAASELGLFEALGEGPVDLDGLAARTGLTRRTARISADAMVAIGLLERTATATPTLPAAAAFLSGATPADMRPLLRFWDRLSYPAWADLAGALGRGRPPQQIFDMDEELVPIMSAGIEAATSGACQALPAAAGLPCGEQAAGHRWRHRVVGDRAGGGRPGPHGHGARARRRRRPSPRAHVHASGILRPGRHPRRRRARDGELPAGYDAFLLANVVHYFTPETNHSILRRIRAAAQAGARLLLADFWTDPTHTQPLPAALMAGEFAVHLNDGDVYSVEEATAWLSGTGWRLTSHTPLAGPISLVAAEAV